MRGLKLLWENKTARLPLLLLGAVSGYFVLMVLDLLLSLGFNNESLHLPIRIAGGGLNLFTMYVCIHSWSSYKRRSLLQEAEMEAMSFAFTEQQQEELKKLGIELDNQERFKKMRRQIGWLYGAALATSLLSLVFNIVN